MHVGDSGNLRIHLGNRTPLFATVRRDPRKRARSLFIKREDIPGKILSEHRFRLGAQFVSPPTGCEKFNSVHNFSDRDGSDHNLVGESLVLDPSQGSR